MFLIFCVTYDIYIYIGAVAFGVSKIIRKCMFATVRKLKRRPIRWDYEKNSNDI